MTHERKRIIEKALRELPERDRELIKQVFLDERDKDDVCREFKVDREYLRVLLHRAKARFRIVLEEQQASRVN